MLAASVATHASMSRSFSSYRDFTVTFTLMSLSGGTVQPVVTPPEHSSPKLADTVAAPAVSALNTAVSTWPLATLELRMRTDGSTTATGGSVHGPGTPIPPADLSNVTVSFVPVSTHMEGGGVAGEAVTENLPE
jgi:hypothetical protein